ncbi:MAG: ribose 5-phosphate isomerase B [Bacteroidetes bacterium]|nr:ribose 5-phosphate isomerase B [Bacteroidota bacterium]MBT7993419.1 ribose 5-phosphate isomerase B [Bacteroidota bacterium]
MIIPIGCDHAAFEMKVALIEWLEGLGYKLIDFGTNSADSVDYPDFIHPVTKYIEEKKARLGIILCGSGNGAAMTANKHKSIRAALCWNIELAEMARLHNDANILSIPARYISLETAKEIVNTYLNTDFEGGRHQRRLDKMIDF